MDKVTNKNITHNTATLQKKAKKKFVSKGIAYQLYYQNPNSTILKAYQNTMYCANAFVPNKSGTALTTNYCKNRWCLTCGAIRTATLINGYISQFKEFKEPQFLTLTDVTVTAEELPKRIKEFGKSFSRILDNNKARTMKLKGLRKAECTIRPDGKYHYHFHIVLEGKENAKYIRDKWIELHPTCKIEAQDIRDVDEGSMLELFKYTTKLLAKDPITGKREFMDAVRLNVIFEALRGKRTFQPFGDIKAVNEDITEELKPDILLTADMVYKWQYQDWVNEETGECLSGYVASETIKELFKIKKMEPIEKQIEPLLECAERFIAKHPTFKDQIYSIIDLAREDLQGENPFSIDSTVKWLKELEKDIDDFSKASGES